MTAPPVRVAAARMSSIGGGRGMRARPSRSLTREQCYAAAMHKPLLALAAALLTSPAWPDTLIENVNGIQVGADNGLQRFRGLVIGDDGKIVRVLGPYDDAQLRNISRRIDGGGQTLLPGLIDAH